MEHRIAGPRPWRWNLPDHYADTIEDLRQWADDGGESEPADELNLQGMSGEERALAVLIAHPGLSVASIAKRAGVNRTSLYKMQRFQQAKATMKEHAKADYRRRHK